MPRRLREKTQKEEAQQEKEEIPTPQNEAGTGSETKESSTLILDGNNNNINPLLKIVFIQRVLKYVRPAGIILRKSPKGRKITWLSEVPRLLQLRQVSTDWSETIDYYSSIPSDVVIDFCLYLKDFVKIKHSHSEQHTTVARDAFLWISKLMGDAESMEKFCDCVYCIIEDNFEANQILFGTSSVRDSIVTVSKYCASMDSADWFCLSIGNLVCNNEANKVLFGTASVRDALLALSKYCTSSVSAGNFCSVILNIIHQNESNRVLFATEAIRDAILSVCPYIDDYWGGVYACCHVISLFHETNPTLFCIQETVTSLVKLSKIEMRKQSPESICWFLSTVLTLLDSDKKLVNTTEIRNAVERFQKVVNDPAEAKKLHKETVALDKLSNEEYLDKARQLCVEFRKVVSEKSEAST